MIFGGDRMALLDRVKKMLIPEERWKKKEFPADKQDADSQDALTANEKQISVTQSHRQMGLSRLTSREYDLYLLLLEGFTLKESANQLSIKYSTVNTHMSGIYKKLGVNSRAKLIINYRDMKNEKT